MVKKPVTKMSLAEVNEKFGGNGAAGMLPTQSEGKEFGKGDKGKGGGKGGGFGRDFDDSRADGDWGRGGGKGGGGKGGDRDGGGARRNDPESRADTGDWFTKEKVAPGASGGGDDRPRGGGGDRPRGGEGGDRPPPRSNFDRGDRERPREEGGDRPRGDRDGGDRPREPRRERDDNGPAGTDNNWRSGGGMPARDAGGGDRDRDRRDGDRDRPRDGDRGGGGGFGNRRDAEDEGGNWRDRPARDAAPARRDDRDERPAERPRLMLKKKGETTGETEKRVEERDNKPSGGAAQKDEAPWKKTNPKNANKNKEVDDFSEGEDEPQRKKEEEAPQKTGGKYVPPSQRGKKEEPQKKDESDDEDSDEEEAPKKPAKKQASESGSEEEEKKEAPKPAAAAKYVPPSRNRQDDEQEDRRRDDEPQRKVERGRFDDDDDDKPKKKAPEAAAGGKYVPAHMRKKQEEEDARNQERRAREQAEEDDREAKKAAEKEARQSKKLQQKDEKDGRAREGQKTAVEKKPKAEEKKKDEAPALDQDKISAFAALCNKAVENAKSDVKALVKEVDSILSDAELNSCEPARAILEPLLRFCRSKDDKQVVAAVGRFAPLLKTLADKSKIWRFKVQLLCETQKLAFDMGLPRLSPASALIEVFFDGLYQAEVVEEKYFELWSMNSDDTAGKTKAMFQLNDFLDWLRTASIEGETDSEEEQDENKEGSDEEEDEEDDDDDIEANVPKRAGVKPIQR